MGGGGGGGGWGLHQVGCGCTVTSRRVGCGCTVWSVWVEFVFGTTSNEDS